MDAALALAMLVVVFLPDPPASRIGTATACASTRPAPPATMTLRGLKTFVKRTFGERAAGAMFTAELTSRAAAITCRLSELRVLDLDAQALARYDALRDHLEDVEARVAIIFGTAPQRIVRSTGLPDDWRRRVDEALRHSTRLECLIAELLTYDDVWPSDGSGDVRTHPMYAKIDPALTALWDTVNGRP